MTDGERVWCAGERVVLTPLTVVTGSVLVEREFDNMIH